MRLRMLIAPRSLRCAVPNKSERCASGDVVQLKLGFNPQRVTGVARQFGPVQRVEMQVFDGLVHQLAAKVGCNRNGR